jgi:hypothetical protein
MHMLLVILGWMFSVYAWVCTAAALDIAFGHRADNSLLANFGFLAFCGGWMWTLNWLYELHRRAERFERLYRELLQQTEDHSN